MNTRPRQARKVFVIDRRMPPGSAYAVYDVKCVICDWRSSGWDWRRNALDAGFAHAAKEH
jgi:hypothetical protein